MPAATTNSCTTGNSLVLRTTTQKWLPVSVLMEVCKGGGARVNRSCDRPGAGAQSAAARVQARRYQRLFSSGGAVSATAEFWAGNAMLDRLRKTQTPGVEQAPLSHGLLKPARFWTATTIRASRSVFHRPPGGLLRCLQPYAGVDTTACTLAVAIAVARVSVRGAPV